MLTASLWLFIMLVIPAQPDTKVCGTACTMIARILSLMAKIAIAIMLTIYINR